MHSATSYFTPPTVWWEKWEMGAHQCAWKTYESVFPINHHQGRPSVSTGEDTVGYTQVGAALDISISPQINGSSRLPLCSASQSAVCDNRSILSHCWLTLYTPSLWQAVTVFLHRWKMIIHNVHTRQSSQLCLDRVWKGLPLHTDWLLAKSIEI